MTALTERLNRFENRLHSMEAELLELRALVGDLEPEPAPKPEPEFVWTVPEIPEPAPQPEPTYTPPPRRERREVEIDWSVLVGARALAWTGGAVMLLGIVFFFVLAVNRGWIGPVTRVSLGVAASAIAVGAGGWLRGRFGDTYASVSAAGAGIAGFYASLLAATALYDLVPRPAALALAAAIAGCGAGLAMRWGSQTLATLGLLGAVLVPVPIAIQDGHWSPVGTAFAAVVLAATALVTIPRAWHGLYVTVTVIATFEALALVIDHARGATPVAIAVWLISATAAMWIALRGRLTYVPVFMVTLSAVFAGWSAGLLYHGHAQGYALLAVAGSYAAASGALWRRDRDSAAILWAIALTVAAVGAAALTSGVTLTIVWAFEAAALARLAKRIAEPRFQLAALAWLALAFVHGLIVDAPLEKLFVANDDTWRAALSAAALALGTAVVAISAFEWEPREEGILAPLFDGLRATQSTLKPGGLALAGASALYAGSLFVVTLPASWSTGHVAVAALWSAVAVVLVLRYRIASLMIVACSTVLVLGYDLHRVDDPQRWWSFAVVAAAAAVVAIVDQVDVESFAMLAVAAGLSTTAVAELLDDRARGVGLLALGAAFGVVGVAHLARRRDVASACGLVGLALAFPATVILLDGTWTVLAFAAASIALALLARFEERLLYAALAYFGFAFLHTLVYEAQPSDLFVSQRHPGGGVPAVVLLVAAAATLTWRSDLLRTAAAWVAGALALYATTLGLLELFEAAGVDVPTSFQRGHTAVSVLWGVIGLGLLIAGLKRSGKGLKLGGLALFALSLAKLFLYDLANLSSVARALSFLGVGALILVGAFFYQRLAADVHSPA